jgi:hypothetical protein
VPVRNAQFCSTGVELVYVRVLYIRFVILRQPSAKSERGIVSPQRQDPRYAIVLFVRSYRSLEGTVIGDWWNDGNLVLNDRGKEASI